MAQYNLVFQGEIVADAALEDVKNNIAKLFKADAEKTAQLFSGKPIVIKKNLDEQTSNKYLDILNKAGAIAKKIPIPDSTSNSEISSKKVTTEKPTENISINPQTPPHTSPPSQTSSGGLSAGLSSLVNYNQALQTSVNDTTASETSAQQVFRDSIEEAVPDAGDILPHPVKEQLSEIDQGLQLAPENSANLIPEREIEAVAIGDISHFSMSDAETGSLEEFTRTQVPIKLPDISLLSMSAAQTGSLEEFTQEATTIDLPDISSLSMSEAQQGSLEGIEKKPEAAAIPDISHLKFS